MRSVKDALALEIFGRTVTEAHDKGVCVKCGQSPDDNCYSDAGRREWCISGLCEKCFDEITEEPDK